MYKMYTSKRCGATTWIDLSVVRKRSKLSSSAKICIPFVNIAHFDVECIVQVRLVEFLNSDGLEVCGVWLRFVECCAQFVSIDLFDVDEVDFIW